MNTKEVTYGSFIQKLKKFLFGLCLNLKIKNPDIKKKIGTPKGPIYKKFVKELSV